MGNKVRGCYGMEDHRKFGMLLFFVSWYSIYLKKDKIQTFGRVLKNSQENVEKLVQKANKTHLWMKKANQTLR